MKILLTDGNERSTLAAARDLAADGHLVVTGHHSRRSLTGFSRSVRESIVYPDPAAGGDPFVESLAREIRTRGIEALIPMTDLTVSTVLARRDRFGGDLLIPFPSGETWERAADKLHLIEKAEELGIPVPRTVVLHRVEECARVPSDLFPCVAKARVSGLVREGRWRKTRVQRAEERGALREAIGQMEWAGPPYLVQESIRGPGVGIFLLVRKGEVLASFAHRRVREKPPEGGVSTSCESAPLRGDLAEHAARLLGGLGWDGVAMVEFKEDLRDGKPKLMEVNGRLWGSLQLAVSCGVPFPRLLVRSFLGEKIPSPRPYPVGRKLQWILGDLDHLLAVALRGKKPAGGGDHAAARALLGFARGLLPGVHHQVFSLSDPRPWAHECGEYVRALFHRDLRS
ncbi:MAG: ATP-grasp domain-containing protein [Candidatus Eisenbacteria bacterium]